MSVKPFQNPSDLPEELHFITDYMQEMWEGVRGKRAIATNARRINDVKKAGIK